MLSFKKPSYYWKTTRFDLYCDWKDIWSFLRNNNMVWFVLSFSDIANNFDEKAEGFHQFKVILIKNNAVRPILYFTNTFLQCYQKNLNETSSLAKIIWKNLLRTNVRHIGNWNIIQRFMTVVDVIFINTLGKLLAKNWVHNNKFFIIHWKSIYQITKLLSSIG